MKNNIVTHFYVKEARKDSQLSTNKRIKPEAWDRSSERVAGRTEPARITNTYLDTLNSKVSKYFSNIVVKDDIVSVHQEIAELKGTSQNKMSLVKAYESHITKLDALVGIDYAANTVKKYRSSLNGLKKFMEKILYNIWFGISTLMNQLRGLLFDFGTQRTIFGTHSKVCYKNKVELCI